jgi:hypothetical protein
VPGLIFQATGTFQNVSSGIIEQGQVGGSGPEVANSFSLQLNTQFFSGSPACSGSFRFSGPIQNRLHGVEERSGSSKRLVSAHERVWHGR